MLFEDHARLFGRFEYGNGGLKLIKNEHCSKFMSRYTRRRQSPTEDTHFYMCLEPQIIYGTKPPNLVGIQISIFPSELPLVAKPKRKKGNYDPSTEYQLLYGRALNAQAEYLNSLD